MFYSLVLVQAKIELKGMLDTGLMMTTLSTDVVPRLLPGGSLAPVDIVLIVCGGRQTSPLGVCDMLRLMDFVWKSQMLIVEG